MRTTCRSLLGTIGLTALLVGALVLPVAAHDVGSTDLGLEDIVVEHVSVVPGTGLVTATGHIVCSQDIEVAFVSVGLVQYLGRTRSIEGNGWTQLGCAAADGTASFELTIVGWSGRFGPGKALLSSYADTGFCDEELGECFFDAVEHGPDSIRISN